MVKEKKRKPGNVLSWRPKEQSVSVNKEQPAILDPVDRSSRRNLDKSLLGLNPEITGDLSAEVHPSRWWGRIPISVGYSRGWMCGREAVL
jgi:hypothetical protein